MVLLCASFSLTPTFIIKSVLKSVLSDMYFCILKYAGDPSLSDCLSFLLLIDSNWQWTFCPPATVPPKEDIHLLTPACLGRQSRATTGPPGPCVECCHSPWERRQLDGAPVTLQDHKQNMTFSTKYSIVEGNRTSQHQYIKYLWRQHLERFNVIT